MIMMDYVQNDLV